MYELFDGQEVGLPEGERRERASLPRDRMRVMDTVLALVVGMLLAIFTQ
jgi:hypothetical protein